jgi:septum formation protein
MTYASIVLASRSPRRSELLRQIGVPHEVLAVDFDEARLGSEPARAYVERLARDKAVHAYTHHRPAAGRRLLAADTAVVLEDQIFGKPDGEEDCLRMLGALSGRTHEVVTGVAVHDGDSLRSSLCVSRVTFRAIGRDEIHRYWLTGEPADKAGAYAVQGLGAVFIERLEGSYSGVMGLPLYETARLLREAGVPLWNEALAA